MTQLNHPHQWVILQLPENNYKVFVIWHGSYLTEDSWKINSGIVKVIIDNEYYYMYGYSGSCYVCHKNNYGITSTYGLDILNKILTQYKNEIKLIDNVDDAILILDKLKTK